MSEQMEKLAEEIDGIIFYEFSTGIIPTRKEALIKAIARILSAVCDGLPLPGEVGRLPVSPQMARVIGWNMRVKEEASTFIALSPASHRDPRRGGTGTD